jgi:hypothetical protein
MVIELNFLHRKIKFTSDECEAESFHGVTPGNMRKIATRDLTVFGSLNSFICSTSQCIVQFGGNLQHIAQTVCVNNTHFNTLAHLIHTIPPVGYIPIFLVSAHTSVSEPHETTEEEGH